MPSHKKCFAEQNLSKLLQKPNIEKHIGIQYLINVLQLETGKNVELILLLN